MQQQNIKMLLASPRSLSTAFYVSMFERGDIDLLHEPWTIQFWVHKTPVGMSSFQTDYRPPFLDIEETDEMARYVENEAKYKPIFVKDAPMATAEFLLSDKGKDFIKKTRFTFLLRHPIQIIASFYKRLVDDNIDVDKVEATKNAVNFITMLAVYNHIKTLTGIAPLVLHSDDLQRNPEATMKKYCKYNNIPFKRESLHWKKGTKPIELTISQSWHQGVFKTTGFQPLDEKATTRAMEIINQSPDRDGLLTLFSEQKQAYNALLALKEPIPNKSECSLFKTYKNNKALVLATSVLLISMLIVWRTRNTLQQSNLSI